MEERGILFLGVLIVCFYNMDLVKLDVEVGFFVVIYIDGKNEIL